MTDERQSGDRPNAASLDKTPETAAVTSESQSSQRFWLTNDLLAVLLVVSFVGFVAAESTGLFDIAAIPRRFRAVYLSLVITAAGWTFGEAAYRTWSGK